MGRKTWLILLCLVATTVSAGDRLESLLERYSQISQLYRQTVEESEGHLIVFTREELERFQYRKLSDVLQVIRYFTLQRNQFGEKILSYATIYPVENSTVRLFINDHEVSSVFRKTALPMWADLPLDFVEHIEIYQGESSVKFNNEAAGMIIKVYTKRPERENGGRIRAEGSTRKDYGLNLYTGMETSKEGAFSFFISRSKYLSRKYTDGPVDVRINERKWYSYIQFKIKGWNFESGFVEKKSGRFRGTGIFYPPEDSDFEGSHGYVSLGRVISTELNLSFRLYADKINTSSYQKGSISNPVLAYIPVQTVLWWSTDISSYKVGADFSGKKRYGRLLISFGGKFQKTGYTLYDTRDLLTIKDINSSKYGSVFTESIYNLFSGLGVIAGVKFEKMDRRYGTDINNILWRTGLISIVDEGRYFKIFLSRYYTPPYFIEIYTNPELGKQKNDVITAELSEKNRFGRFVITGGYIKVNRAIMIDPLTFTYYNSEDTLKYRFYSVDYKKVFRNILFEAGYFNVSVNNKAYKTAPSAGGDVKMSYFTEGFSSFFEVIYRNSYSFLGRKIDSGLNLNTGFRIKPFENSFLEVKGYNLAGRGLKTPAYIDPDFKYTVEDRRVTLSFIREF
ncbi:TonB-dependent receptor plug domain-containing protein [Persephonella sp.]